MMKKQDVGVSSAMAVALLLMSFFWFAQIGQSSGQSPTDPLGDIKFLVGGVWSADLPATPDGTHMSTELKADWTPNHQAIRFDSVFVSNGKRTPYTSGCYFWNAAKARTVFAYADREGSLIEGDVFLENGALRHEFTITNREGKVEKVRALITPHLPDGYTNDIFIEKEGAWSKMASVSYRRRTNE